MKSFFGLILWGVAVGSAQVTVFDDAKQEVVDSPFVLKYGTSGSALPRPQEVTGSDAEEGRPFITLHGVGDACSNSGMQHFTSELAAAAGAYGACIEYGAGTDSWFTTIPSQVEKACSLIRADPKLAGGFNIVGLSQGNCVARGVIEQCDGIGPVHNYVSLGGPHMGVATVPQCSSGVICKLLNGFIGLGVYTSLAQHHVGPANYFKDPKDLHTYLKDSIWLPVVNNENTINATYQSRMTALNKVTLVKFAADTVVDPKESEWFGYYAPDSHSTIQLFNETDDYKQDSFGVKTLSIAGKLNFVTQPGQHLNIDQKLVDSVIVPQLKNTDEAAHIAAHTTGGQHWQSRKALH